MITKFLKTTNIIIKDKAEEKYSAINSLVAILHLSGCIKSPEKIYRAVIQRENIIATGIGNGLALPHAKISDLDRPCVAALTLTNGISWSVFDTVPVDLIFLVVYPVDKSGDYLSILNEICRIGKNPKLRDTLRAAETSEDFFRQLDVKEHCLKA